MDPEPGPSPDTGTPERMDSDAASSSPPPTTEEKSGVPSDPPPPKKPRYGDGDLGRVAEIVLVLSAMGRMRGGRDPTGVELELMGEARDKLTAICETLAPKDIVAGETVGRVIDDLGLNVKARDQRMGFKVTKLSIAEKLAFTRRKMEESKKYPTHTTTYISPSLQGSFSSGADNRGTLPARTFQPDKPIQPPASAGGFVDSPALGVIGSSSQPNVSAEKSTTVTYQFGPAEARTSTVSSALAGAQSGKDSFSAAAPKVERTISPDVIEIGSSFTPRTSVVQASSHVNQPVANAPTWTLQAQPTSLSRVGPERYVFNHGQSKAEEASNMTMSSAYPQTARDQARRPIVTRTASVQPQALHHQQLQAVAAPAPSNYSNHHEISKIVQKFLPPKLPEHPIWTPPSREYMNKAITCQICQTTVNDVESVLLCDACEKGYHLKCLQSQGQRGIPKVEWHCQKCLVLSHGKPLPPKYGRVMRNMAAPKVTSNVTTAQTSLEKKTGVDSKVDPQNVQSTESSGAQNIVTGAGTGSTHTKCSSDVQLPKGREIQDQSPSVGDMQPKSLSESGANNSITAVGPDFGSSDCSFIETSMEDMNVCESSTGESGLASQEKSETPAKESGLSSSLPSSDTKGAEPAEHAGDPAETYENSQSERKETEKSLANNDKIDSSTGSARKVEHILTESNVDSNTGSYPKEEESCPDDHADSSIGNDAKLEESCAEEKSCAGDHVDSSARLDARQEKSREAENLASSTINDTRIGDADAEHDLGHSSITDITTREIAALPLDVPDPAQWLGDILEQIDEKAFYGSCCISGVTYKLNQHALFQSSRGKLIPLKLQAMWEDKFTGQKWVKVNSCFFPGDLPDDIGRPFSETNEVFESNHEETLMAGTIQGPCEVLPSAKYKEESERRSDEANTGQTPLFLCKWFYDESKGHFQPVSS